MNTILIALAGLISFNIFVTPIIEHQVSYYPTKEIKWTPQEINISYEDIFLTTSDNVKINAWYIDNPNSEDVVLYLHGNGGNLSVARGFVDLFYQIPFDILVLDYHGFGKSEGHVSEKNLYLDTAVAYEYLTHVHL